MNRNEYFAAVKANEEVAAKKAAEEKEAETSTVPNPVASKPKRDRSKKKK